MENIINWFTDSEPWVRYKTKTELLDLPYDSSDVLKDKNEIIKAPKIKSILNELKEWPNMILKRHNDAKHLIHKLSFVADIGLDKTNKDIEKICSQIFNHQSKDGPFQIKVNIPTRFGGKGEDQLTWMLCDAPLLTYSLIKFGYKDKPEVKNSIDYLLSLIDENGWRCKADSELGKFRGPGRKNDPCPYANLLMLKMIAEIPELKDSKQAKTGINTILELWEKRTETKPYLFGMGTDFKKLKAPFIWYDILHVMEVLSKFPQLKNNKAINSMLNIIEKKQDIHGYYYAESAYRAWKDWDFGQKKEPSQWITLLSNIIIKRLSPLRKVK
ncbi:MAG: hypothetical protein KAT68_10665, partial [Bacteroidales bacterium]|nr:hypothetical protein [Bacteroidales bacterium]